MNFIQKGWRRFFTYEKAAAQPGPIVLKRRKIYILPTRSGLWFALVLFVMLLGSMNYNNSMGYALTFLLGSMAIVSILHTHRTLLGLRIEVGKVLPVFAGETAHFQLWLDNRGHTARYGLVWVRDARIENTSWLRDTVLEKIKSKTNMDVPANQRVSLILPVPTTQRGKVFLGRVMLYTHFPVGLFHAWTFVHLDLSTLVYPQALGHKVLPLGFEAQTLGEGQPRDGGGEDFMGYRDYKPGDSPRHIDWKAVAREQDWMIKQFGGMSAAEVWLTWDEVAMVNDVEMALSQLCLWILVAENQGALYGLKIPNCTLEPDRGEAHRDRCLQALALFQ
jgi:uncharacterized protein (DUF58 family)